MIQTQDPLVGLLAFIGERKILLVLDNCEHVIDVAAPLAERVVSEAPQAHVLATSREALRVEGEHVHRLYALDCPPEDASLTATEALKYPAAQLFMERAAASGYGSELSDVEAPIVARICRGLDGIALAVELAASRTGSYGIRETAELLDNRFKLLWQGRRTARPRHQTLNAMLDWSYNLLSEHEKIVLRRLSVFVGDFTLRAACSVAAEAEAIDADISGAIVSLGEKSLISTRVINGSTYYRLLDTTRTYAAAKLAKNGESDRTSRLHAISYSEYLEHDDVIQSSFGERDLAEYAPHIGNVRAALAWTLSDRGDIAVGIQLTALSAPLLIGLSLLEECRYWCDQAIAALDDTWRGTRQEMILQEALALSSMFTRGHSDQVRGAIERGLRLAETFEDRARQLHLLAGVELSFTRLSDFRGALARAEQVAIVARAARHPAGLVWAEWTLGLAHHGLGNQTAAQLHCERGLALAVKLGTTTVNFFGCDQCVRILVNLARTLWLRGLPDRAQRTSQQAINEAAKQNHPVSICMSLLFASTVFLWIGDLPRAADFIDQLIAHAGRHSLEPYRAGGTAVKGALAIARNEVEVGVDLLRATLGTLRSEQYNVLSPEIIGALAEGLWRIGHFKEALLAVNDIIAFATDRGARFYLAELMRIKALILASMPQLVPRHRDYDSLAVLG
jgi:predicted ATPase